MVKSDATHEILCVEGLDAPLALRRSQRARRITLRVDPTRGAVVLTLPEGVSRAQGARFAARNRGWIACQLAALPAPVPFAPESRLPILGRDHVIRHAPEARRGVWREDDALWVSGAREHLARRVRDFLIRLGRHEISARVDRMAALLPAGHGRRRGRISLRDTSSRWGSCSSSGDLNFSWRLVLAPEPVLNYVVAHEVAHLVHLDHSVRFWAVVRSLTGDSEAARRWLRSHGAGLHRYG